MFNLIIRNPLIKNIIALLLIATAIIASKTEGDLKIVFSVVAFTLFVMTLFLLIVSILGNETKKRGRWILLGVALISTLVFYLIM